MARYNRSTIVGKPFDLAEFKAGAIAITRNGIPLNLLCS